MQENRSGNDRRVLNNRRCTNMEWKRNERREAINSGVGRRMAFRR